MEDLRGGQHRGPVLDFSREIKMPSVEVGLKYDIFRRLIVFSSVTMSQHISSVATFQISIQPISTVSLD